MVIHRRGMRPNSLGWRPHIGIFDILWVWISAILAFWLRNPESFSLSLPVTPDVKDACIYAAISVACAPFVFAWIGVGEDLTRYFSGREARGIIVASAFTVAIIAVTNFLLFRLDNAARSVPVLQFLLLSAGLLFGRVLSRSHEKTRDARSLPTSDIEYVLIVGASRLTSFYVRMLDDLAHTTHRPLAIFDEKPSLIGRSIAGCPIVGAPDDLPRVIAEYEVHGIKVHRVVLVKPLASLSAASRAVLKHIETSDLVVQQLDDQLFVSKSHALPQVTFEETPRLKEERAQILGKRYWGLKRAIDIIMATTLLTAMLPLALGVAAVCLINVGHPVLFWQRRVGRYGRPIMVSKFRTFRAPFDGTGQRRSEAQRLTLVGRIIRASRLDEIPQLLSILTGRMSLIGPRPLLPSDQPDLIGLRLLVAPGLTGWAQVNGGTLMNVQEKDALDEWYVRHASLWLDLQIMIRTPWMMIMGDRRSEHAVTAALHEAQVSRDPPTNPPMIAQLVQSANPLVERASSGPCRASNK
jgi:lipopolysaccharide/colanic/teichoic acid biosynthesis glycosyltransferase